MTRRRQHIAPARARGHPNEFTWNSKGGGLLHGKPSQSFDYQARSTPIASVLPLLGRAP